MERLVRKICSMWFNFSTGLMDSEPLDTMSGEQSSHSISSPKRARYIYDLPYDRLKILCDMLDLNDKWKELGK